MSLSYKLPLPEADCLNHISILKVNRNTALQEVLTNKVLKKGETSPHPLLVLMQALTNPLAVLPVLNILKLLSPLNHVILKELKDVLAAPSDMLWLQPKLKLLLLNLLDEACCASHCF